jgi:hypothetical protein
VTAGILLSLVLAAIALAFVLAPLRRADAGEPEVSPADLDGARELESRQQMLLAALRDLDDDRATDKIGEADYRELRERLTAEAVDVMQKLDAAQAEPPPGSEPEASPPLRYPGPRRSGQPR